ncbi:hypothetical protein GCM10011507_11010 [Edaphobacter acidisoli]|uniref:Uncharacterized protein n=1 Tax=Edaphobacter acidisoli TaxID=2040573 RepID=A0A916W242_9BACT|nr:hypothetical protein [Edaphobacter acidisoli]GGA61326.1 hypothetical protein GCM10011507_11010 [Edaphobacter acidisoli]
MSIAPPIAGSASTTTGALRKGASFPVAVGALLIVLSVLTVRSRFNDPDMWWHLKTGEIIWTTHSVPTADLFSYTTDHHAWVPHEWLSQVLIYTAYKWNGYSGLMLWLCSFAALLLVASYILCSLYSGNPKTAFIGALTVWFFATIGFSVRPQMIGYLLLVLELMLIHLGHTRSPRWFYWLPPLFVVWVNCHGSFFLGIIVLGIFLVCSFFHFRAGALVASQVKPKSRLTLILSFLISIGVLFFSPGGLKQVLYPLNTMLYQPINLSQIEEWGPLQLNDPRALVLFGILGCLFLVFLFRRSELFLHELLLLAMGTELAITHSRMLFAFGILVSPMLSRLLSKSWDNYDAAHDHPLMNTVIISAALLIAVIAFPSKAQLASQVGSSNPVGAVTYIKSHDLSGNMLNAYRFGGYLIWALPEHPVFIDGRADLYEWAGVLGDFAQWASLQRPPNDLLDKYQVSFCLLERHSPMVQVMHLLPQWKEAYSDNISVIFVRSSH